VTQSALEARRAGSAVVCVIAASVTVGLLAGCANVQTISPNDPAYNYSGAPRAGQEQYSNGPRPYKPLGGQSVAGG
jgi:hypothetical protein